MALASDKLRRIILSGADTIIDGDVVLVNGIEDTVNSDGVRMPQGFLASDDCVLNGKLNMDDEFATTGGVAADGAVAGGPSPVFQQTIVTAALDLTQVQSLVIVPALVGYFPVMGGRNWILVSHAGTMTTGVSCKAGNNVAHDNFIGATTNSPTAAVVNATTPPSVTTGPSFPTSGATQIPNAAVTLDITLGAVGTGGFALSARLAFTVGWFPG